MLLKDHPRILQIDRGGWAGGMAVLCVVQERDNRSWGMVLAVEREHRAKILQVLWKYRSQQLVKDCL